MTKDEVMFLELVDMLRKSSAEKQERENKAMNNDVFNIREELERRGAKTSQLNASVVDMMEDIIADNNGELPKGTTGRADRLIAMIEHASKRLEEASIEVDRSVAKAETTSKNMTATAHRLEELGANAKASNVSDKVDIEALNVFAATIDIVKAKVPEAQLTEAVWICGIQSASYMAWRSIMGTKDPNDKRRG